MNGANLLTFPVLLQRFFTQRLMQHHHASPQTIAAYRDCFRLLLHFAEQHLDKSPSDLRLDDLNAGFVLAFLHHLEADRHNSIRTRNARLAAIRSFMDYVAFEEPAALALTQAVRAIPMKRFERPLLGFLSRPQIEAILAAPDPHAWIGQRDRVMFAMLYNTGARVSELIGMRVADLTLKPTASVQIRGKGRKQRIVPLWRETATALKHWLRASPRAPDQPLFPNRSGHTLTRVGFTERLALAAKTAAREQPELATRRVSPHVIRHSTAMHMLQSGVDITVIALWLGHESTATTHHYLEADLAMKERVLSALAPPATTPWRYRPTDRVMQFLRAL